VLLTGMCRIVPCIQMPQSTFNCYGAAADAAANQFVEDAT